MSMNPNVGGVDRVLRIAAGVVLLALTLTPGLQIFGAGLLAWVAGIIGVVLVATGVVRICPLYSLLGINT
jgi:hypothetical protein